jgi:hypothetical protein
MYSIYIPQIDSSSKHTKDSDKYKQKTDT